MNFKAGVADTGYCYPGAGVCALFGTWQASVDPCQVRDCTACTMEHPTCGVFQPSTNTTTCAWRYIECKGGRVSKLMLGKHCLGTSTAFQTTFSGQSRVSMVRVCHRI